MFPELFNFTLPDFLGGKHVSIYTYAFLIAFGSLLAGAFTKWRAKKELGIHNISNNFFYGIFIAGFIGGKLFFYLQTPMEFINNPSLLLNNFSGGFVFYGSFVVIIPYIVWYLRRHKIPVLPMLDIFALTTLLIHSIGRVGCFAAGCCFGKLTDSFFGLVFPTTQNQAVHPTQLYEISVLILIAILLIFVKRHQRFSGQIFLIYLMLYAFGRGILELFRGDDRGFIINDILSHSQFIGLCLIGIALFSYIKIFNQHKQQSISI